MERVERLGGRGERAEFFFFRAARDVMKVKKDEKGMRLHGEVVA